MAAITLTEGDQVALHAVLVAEPVPGDPLPTPKVLQDIATLVPCDAIGAVLVDHQGQVLHQVTLRQSDAHLVDEVAVDFRNGPDLVVRIGLGRCRVRFSSRDLTLVQLITPALQRLVRERPAPSLPPSLTTAELRVLVQVAAGRSNREIAQSLFIAPSTVRKHLEHSFRKLGVTSRFAALARLQGRDLPDLDLRGRISRFG